MTKTKKIKVAIAGQPNTGKSTLFNHLTKSRQHVGNWPGKTVEKKTGFFSCNNIDYEITDLPGSYSLTARSAEEEITKNYIVEEKPDTVIVMADASQLERSLFFLTEIKMLHKNIILALNMVDIALKKGKKINHYILEKELGVTIVPMVASKKDGIESLQKSIENLVEFDNQSYIQIYESINEFNQIKNLLLSNEISTNEANWHSLKLLEKDESSLQFIKSKINAKDYEIIKNILASTEFGTIEIAELKYQWIEKALKKSVDDSNKNKTEKLRKFDRIATHGLWGKILAITVIIVSFLIPMIIAMPLVGSFLSTAPMLSKIIKTTFENSVPFLGTLLGDGLLPGLYTGIGMMAFITIIKFFFIILEQIGYLARLAFLFDGAMHKIGLHGKSIMPLVMSFGCNVAGVSGSRVIDDSKQRIMTLVSSCLVPCLGMWAVTTCIGGLFFKESMPVVFLSLLAVVIIHINITTKFFGKLLNAEKATGLIMELPPYHKVNWRIVFSQLWVHIKSFTKKVVVLLSIVSIIVWLFSYQKDGNISNSFLGKFGQFFEPITMIFGIDWKLFLALVAATIAKESALTVLAVLYGMGSADSITGLMFGGSGEWGLEAVGQAITHSVTPASALAFLFAFFFTIPCLGTAGSIHSETKSLKWTLGIAGYLTLSSVLYAFLAYHVGLLIF